MKPVVIFRHLVTEGPGYFATWLERHGVPWRVVKIDAEEAVPDDPTAFSGLCFMGGPMSANDDLPWIRDELALIRRAVDADIPVVGHCLGGQLMARAMGGSVTRNPVKEIGWGAVTVADGAEAKRWFAGTPGTFDAFHWHGETFSLPPGAARLLSSAHCANQAFGLGRHLGMQCHIEMTAQLVRDWCRDWGREVGRLAARVPSVQAPDEMTAELDARVKALHEVADRVYAEWAKGLRP